MRIGEIELKWLGHSGFLIKNSKIIYIDPYNIKGNMEKIVQEGTKIIMTADCQSKITRFEVPIKMEVIEAGQELDLGDVKISTLPSYNIDKSFHPKDESWVGYLIKINNILIYHAGDSDLIPKMQKLTGYKQSGKEFIALLPIGGRFTMNAEEAAEVAKIIKPTIAIPMHYGSIVGTGEDAEEFKELCEENNIRVEILE